MHDARILIIIFSFLGISCISTGNGEKVAEENLDDRSKGFLINVNPERDQFFNLSEIIEDWNIIALSSVPEALIGYPRKVVDFENKLFFYDPSVAKSVVVFDRVGNYINKIGRKGKAPDELINLNGFTVDFDKRQVVLGDNGQYIKRYDFNGKLVSSIEQKLFYRDMEISGNNIAFATAKKTNFSNGTEDPISFNLWVQDTINKEFDFYFPYDYAVFPNGISTNEVFTSFLKFKDQLFYNQGLNDTIYGIDRKEVYPSYIVNFGERKSKENLLNKDGEWIAKYYKSDPYEAYMVQNFIITPNIIKFDYLLGNSSYSAFYNINSDTVLTGKMVNDFFGLDLMITHTLKEELLAIVEPFRLHQLLESGDLSHLNEKAISNLKKLCSTYAMDSNLLLVVLKTKPG